MEEIVNCVKDRIETLVLKNPGMARALLYDKGFEPPENLNELVGAIKELFGQSGRHQRTEIKERLQQLVEKICDCQQEEESNFCGSCGASFMPEKRKRPPILPLTQPVQPEQKKEANNEFETKVNRSERLIALALIMTGFLIGYTIKSR